MLVLVKKPHTDIPIFEIKGEIPDRLLNYLKNEMEYMIDFINEEETTDITKTDWYRKIDKELRPGDAIRVYRSNLGLSQTELGRRLGGLSRQKISDLENHRRGISKEMAKKLSQILQVPINRLV